MAVAFITPGHQPASAGAMATSSFFLLLCPLVIIGFAVLYHRARTVAARPGPRRLFIKVVATVSPALFVLVLPFLVWGVLIALDGGLLGTS